MRARGFIVIVALGLAGCPQDVRPFGTPDATPDGAVAGRDAETEDASRVDAGAADATPADARVTDAAETDAGPVEDAGAAADAGFGPNDPCEAVVLGCLDPAPADVHSVPDEMAWADALAAAQANHTIQLVGLQVPSGIRIPPGVIFRGCDGAEIVGSVGFEGLGGRVEGFDVTGSIIANQTGTYVVRRNRFHGTNTEAAVSARSADALVSASVTMLVEQNLFEGRRLALEARTRYDTMVHEVDLRARNNVFTGCGAPIQVSETGIVGRITAEIAHNTFYDFDDAIRLDNFEQPVALAGNLFALGQRAVAGASPFTIEAALIDAVDTPSQSPPFSGTFLRGNAGFVDAANGDFRLTTDSDAIDVVGRGVSSAEGLDYLGCPRPVPYRAAEARGDLGAFEAQP